MNDAALVLLLAIGAGACAHRDPGWTDPDPAPPLDGTAVRAAAPFSLAAHAGRVVLVSFGYTSCVEVCPDTFASAKTVFRELGDAATGVDFVYVTVDPERDDPAHLRSFLAGVDPRFEGLYVAPDALPALLAAWHVTVRKRLPDPGKWSQGSYSMDHTAGFWGVDRRGRLRFHLDHDTPDADLVAATRKLAEEAR